MYKLLAFDMLSICYRWHHRLEKNPLMHQNINTSAIHGFFYTVFSMIRHYQPTHLAVCADSKGKTFRHAEYSEYKSGRSAKPEAMQIAEDVIERLCPILQLPFLRVEGAEADDVVGTIVRVAAAAGMRVYLVSADKDLGQLVRENVIQVQPSFGEGFVELGVAEVCKKWNVDKPSDIVEVMALVGDDTDNVPGVKGIGPKNAGQLIRTYKTAISAYQHRNELTPAMERRLTDARDALAISRWLVEVRTDLEDFLPRLKDLVWKPVSVEVAAPYLDRFGLTRIKELLAEFAQPFNGKA